MPLQYGCLLSSTQMGADFSRGLKRYQISAEKPATRFFAFHFQGTKHPHTSSWLTRWKHLAALLGTQSPAVSLPGGLRSNHTTLQPSAVSGSRCAGPAADPPGQVPRCSQHYLMPAFPHTRFSVLLLPTGTSSKCKPGKHASEIAENSEIYRFLSS